MAEHIRSRRGGLNANDAATSSARSRMSSLLTTPYPYFGGKPDEVVSQIWEAVGDTPNYVEPFFGTGRILLGRPSPGKVETVNDINAFVANVWRAIAAAPEDVAAHCDRPVNETDLHAIHRWLVGQAEGLAQRLEEDPAFFDARIAGWWVWGASCWIGSGWCTDTKAASRRQRPHLSGAGDGTPGGGMGVHKRNLPRKMPGLAGQGRAARPHHGKGVHRASARSLPRVGGCDGTGVSYGAGINVQDRRNRLLEWFEALAARVRHVRVCCGDFERILSPAVTTGHGLTAVVLDPPYVLEGRAAGLYQGDTASDEVEVAVRARSWAIEHGEDPLLRIVYCGYEDGFEWPPGWTCRAWKARGGYGLQAHGRGRANAGRERIWLSPGCNSPAQRALF